jgi:hypothetical protein
MTCSPTVGAPSSPRKGLVRTENSVLVITNESFGSKRTLSPKVDGMFAVKLADVVTKTIRTIEFGR